MPERAASIDRRSEGTVRNDLRDALDSWMAALERRHLSSLRPAEVTRALRALSSAYVERRHRGPDQHVRGALDTAGKRAAFALYYAPLHFLAVAAILEALGPDAAAPASIVDLGCGTGAAGAAWALSSSPRPPVTGIDRHPWAVEEARWTYRHLAIAGRARPGDAGRFRLRERGAGVVAAYTLNELSDGDRQRLEDELLDVPDSGGRVLVIEPIARGVAPWWPALAQRVLARGGRSDEWHLPLDPPPLVARLGTAAGLNHRELRARSLMI